MLTWTRRLGVATLAVVSVLGVEVPRADAQLRVMPNSQGIVNPFFRVAPNVPLNQAAFNTRVMGRALSTIPPWVYGYNPYPSPIFSQFPPYPLYGGGFGGGGDLGLSASLSSTGYGGFGGSSLYSNPYGFGGGYGGCYGGGYGGGFGGGYGGFGGGCIDPFAGYLVGASQVIQSQAQFMMSQAQSDQVKEQTRQMRIDTQRKIFEEWQYERNLLANLPDPRDTERKFALHRALNDPPLTEVLTGESLNLIKNNITGLLDRNATGPAIGLDEDMLKEINVTAWGGRANIGLLKNKGRLSWPLSLQGAAFEPERKLLDQLVADAYSKVDFSGQVDAGTLLRMKKDAQALHERLNANIHDITPTQYVEAKRYLNQLDDALAALGQADVRNYLNGTLAAKGKNVEELVRNMSAAGLKFASATQGQEGAYRMLQQRLAAFNAALEQQQTAQK